MVSDDDGLSCVTGSTAIDAVRIALGSTLGAFIALAVVVAFVLLAKCQHRRRVRRVRRRRRRLSSDKSQPLTDSDNVSFFDYYDDDDDEYGSVFNHDVAATSEFSRLPPPPSRRRDKTRLIFTNEFVVPESCREWDIGDVNAAQFYDVTEADHTAVEADSAQYSLNPPETYIKSASDQSVARPAVFVPEAVISDGGDECPVVGQGFRVAPTSVAAPRCFSYDDECLQLTLGVAMKSDVLRPSEARSRLGATGIVKVMPPDSCDTTGLLRLSGDERTPGGLRANHYSSIW